MQHRHRRRLLLLGCLVTASCSTEQVCEDSSECDDGLFCNGPEFCISGQCVILAAPVLCDDGIACTLDTCSEVRDRCEFIARDADEDGVGDASCLDLDGEPLGRDCDDADPDRFPGNREVCDEAGFDEDCDATTFGSVDADGDGLFAAECCNSVDGEFFCGTDCDDTNPAIVPGAQVCLADNIPGVLVCGSDGTYERVSCLGTNERCVEQPNGLGVCQ